MPGGRRAGATLLALASLLLAATFQVKGQEAAKLAPKAGRAVGTQVKNNSEYAGAEACTACHQQAHLKFKNTKMGKILLVNPRSELEARGCDACHGPGMAHVESGGGLEAIIRFGKKSNLSAEEQNEQCLQCHEKGARLFWRGSPHESRGIACVGWSA